MIVRSKITLIDGAVLYKKYLFFCTGPCPEERESSCGYDHEHVSAVKVVIQPDTVVSELGGHAVI